jgi:small subunit ribosomal protein S16
VAVKIKLKRMGKIRAPYYRIVVADSRTKRDGRAIEEIGKYHPKAEPSFIHVESERAQYWLSVGAQPTEPVRRILEITGDWQRFRGEPGAEGTLRTAPVKQTRSERFAEAVGASSGGGETTPKGGGRAKKADADASDKGGDKGKGGGRQRPAAKADTAKADTAKADTAKAEPAKAEPAKADATETAVEPTTEEAKADTATADATETVVEPTAEEAKADTATAETAVEATAEEAKPAEAEAAAEPGSEA